MTPHEEFLELCAAATAGELNAGEQAKLDAHLAECAECRQALDEYEIASRHAAAALAEGSPERAEADRSWSLERAEETFFQRLEKEAGRQSAAGEEQRISAARGQRFTYRPSEIRLRELWMPFAAALLLALALSIAAYRSGIQRGTEVARSTPEAGKGTATPLEEQVSDAEHERAQLIGKLAEEDQVIAGLRRQLSEEQREVSALKARASGRQAEKNSSEARREEELLAAKTKLEQLQKAIDTLAGQREELTARAATLEEKVSELTGQVRDRERERDEKQEQVARQQDLLERDRDIRELMGARDLYVAEVHDVSSSGQTNKTYGRVFYTKGKRLVFYAYDLDAQPGVKNASTFQAWGRRGPDQQQVLNLGIFYEDNISKKRWVLKTNDAKTLDDIDAVFVTVEPNGGSRRPSGKPLLFAYLRLSPNHP
jgi:hypothetical protein